jgi:TIR domain/Protein of unknown function (DUF1036)
MPRIVISYRRTDAAAMSGRIFDRLVTHFGKDAVFMDVDNIPFGIDFRQHINKALEEIDILVVVIGPKWLGGDKRGPARIMDANDPVRIEVETALRRGIPVVPVLVDAAQMPNPTQLPQSLELLSYRNAAEVDTGRDFHPHMDRLIRSMDKILKETGGSQQSKLKTVAIFRLGKIVAVAAIACTGLAIAFVWYGMQKNTGVVSKAAPASELTPIGSRPLQQTGFDAAMSAGTVQAWSNFLRQYPDGPLGDRARQELAKLALAQSKAAFDQAEKAGTIEAWDDFLSKFSSGTYMSASLTEQARQERTKLVLAHDTQEAFDQAKNAGTIQAWDGFLSKISSGTYASAPLAEQARQERTKLVLARDTQQAFDQAKNAGTIQAWDGFLSKISSGAYESDALADQARQERTKLVVAQNARDDESAYRSARGDLQKLQTYISSCTVCTFTDAAKQELSSIQQQQSLDKEKQEDETYREAQGNIDLLKAYAKTCQICAHRSEAEQESSHLQYDAQFFMLRVCNKSARHASVAVGGRIAPDTNEWHVQGWWAVPPGQCSNLRKFVKDKVYVFAQEDGNPSFAWKGSALKACVAFPGPFDLVHSEDEICPPSGKLVSFSSFSVLDPTFTWDLNP